jgi:hypothetical protein
VGLLALAWVRKVPRIRHSERITAHPELIRTKTSFENRE